MKRRICMLRVFIISVILLLLIIPEVRAQLEKESDRDLSDLTQRQLDRFVKDSYLESYDHFLRSSVFYSPTVSIPEESFRFYSFESRILGSSLIYLSFIGNPLLDFIEMLPYEEYYEFLDLYYLSDIIVFSISYWGDIRINLRDLTQGDYFMKLKINLYKPRRLVY